MLIHNILHLLSENAHQHLQSALMLSQMCPAECDAAWESHWLIMHL